MSEVSNTIEFELVSPERLLKSEPVEMVVVPGAEGDIGVLPGHSLLIAAVRPGVIDIHEGGQVRESIFVAGGFAEVSPERCTVLAEEAMLVTDIEKEAAEERLQDAKAALAKADSEEDGDTVAKAGAEKELKTAEAMVAAASAE
ncbi:MAG: ATP synthase F1 subunit epsilon [Rhodospirillaceae bacterium]|jgi:F-type H+-transporting ATPase subunit epsilon|nr:ATP synthase F1 subunit epsilon [Rhodospirillaceae bacterium]|tara:strand:- start:4943 stop:5374 length:432 start_codon:yes stop_codon:yes gene_type:complete